MARIAPIAVVVPNWNGLTFLRDCVPSLSRQSQPHDLIVVDNGSMDGSCTWLRDNHPEATVVALRRNHGFAGGANRGIELALRRNAEYVALLNNDAVADPGWLHSLLVAAEAHPEAGVITGKLLNADGTRIDSTGNLYSTWGFPFPRGRDEDAGSYPTAGYVFAASGGASLYRSAALREIGLFDERFFAYYEDVDLSFRSQLAGWKVWYTPSAIARHVIGGTTSRHPGLAQYHTTKNFVSLYCKNMPAKLFRRHLVKFLTAWVLIAATAVRRGAVVSFMKAFAAAAVGLVGLARERRRVQAGVKVSDEYIESMLYKRVPPTQRTLLGLSHRFLR